MIPGQLIHFIGTLAAAGKPPEEYTVDVLAGEGAPTVNGGWPEWLTIPRPQRVGMTVLQGYQPIKLAVPIRFEAILLEEHTLEGHTYDVEREIQRLEWMAGRGRPLGSHPKPGGTFHGTPGHDALGDSPVVQVKTYSESREVPLVPVQFQSLNWVVDGEAGGITWDANPLRDSGGGRLRQLGTVFLKQLVAAPGTTDSASQRARSRTAGKGVYHKTTSVLNTVKKLVIHYTKNPGAVQEVMEANRLNKAVGTNPNGPLRPGVNVLIPYSVKTHLNNG